MNEGVIRVIDKRTGKTVVIKRKTETTGTANTDADGGIKVEELRRKSFRVFS